ncbi:hypothetical protein GQ42DRAFT_164526 [Ramicandelaber brevisporus]|nr:hypothetical protein GQ42DRAFT_164526 [Ramicandelaber brevisporus]
MQPVRPIVPVGTHAGAAWGRLVSSPLLGSANSCAYTTQLLCECQRVSTLVVSTLLRAHLLNQAQHGASPSRIVPQQNACQSAEGRARGGGGCMFSAMCWLSEMG